MNFLRFSIGNFSAGSASRNIRIISRYYENIIFYRESHKLSVLRGRTEISRKYLLLQRKIIIWEQNNIEIDRLCVVHSVIAHVCCI